MIGQVVPVLLLVVIADLAVAVTVTTTETEQAVVTSQVQSVSKAAARWGLTSEDWLAYEEAMQDRRGVWSPGLDPITALGVSADTTAERKRYAELYVRTEFERTRKELAFQLAVDSAWTRLYPDTPRIGSRNTANDVSLAASRYALIVTPNCIECERVLQQRLAAMIGEAEEGVDVHVVGTGGDDDVLRGWIATKPDLLAALKAGRATLNHGSRFQDVVQFPAIYSKRGGGQWAREL